MSRTNATVRIFLYNWPIYTATWLGAAVITVVAVRSTLPIGVLFVAAALAAVPWSAVSLLVSHYIYDRSELASARWVSELLPSRVETWATIDAGLDAEVVLDGVMPGRCIARLDIFDGIAIRAPSVKRARALTPRARPATPSAPTALALKDASCDAIAIIFTAHELRAREVRERFFNEVKRALRDGGRMILVEHVRDARNLLAFGPGFLHFVARSEWLRLARATGWRVAAERRVTPWVMALALERSS